MCFCINNVNAITLKGQCGDTTTYSLIDNMLTITGIGVVNDDSGWIDYFDVIDTLIIHDGITELEASLFSDFKLLTSVTLPNTLEAIGSRTFSGCTALSKIVIPNSVTSINRYSFRGCENLIIYCDSGSYAEEYARANSINYKIISNITISFDANGGENAPAPLTGTMTEDSIIPTKKPTRSNYIFAGWATTADATVSAYAVGDKINTSEDVTLYALWFRCNIAENSTENKLIIESNVSSPDLKLWIAAYEEKRVVALKQKDVQLFPGNNDIETEVAWDNINRDEVKVFLWDFNMIPYTTARNVTLIKPNTVTFIDWDGTILSNQNVWTGENAAVPITPTREGYTFCGWSGNYTNVISDSIVIAQYVDSAKDNVFKVFTVKAQKEDTIKLVVYLGGKVETCGFDMKLKYDKDALEFIDMDAALEVDAIANHNSEEGSIRFNYSSSKNRTKGARILAAEFKIKETAGDVMNIDLIPVEIIKIDAEQDNIPVDAAYNIENGTITVY